MPGHRQVIDFMKRTHGIYCGLRKEEITLMPGDPPGRTDAESYICVPFEDPDVDLIHAHEWSHIFFRSDLRARDLFVSSFIAELETKGYLDVNSSLTDLTLYVSNALDDLRVNSLWNRIYPGSARLIENRWVHLIDLVRRPEDSIVLVILGTGIGARAAGAYQARYHTLVGPACRMVVGGSYASVLAATKMVMEGLLERLGRLPRRAQDERNDPRTAQERLSAQSWPEGRERASLKAVGEERSARVPSLLDLPNVAPKGDGPDPFMTHRTVQVAMGPHGEELERELLTGAQEMDTVIGELRSVLQPVDPDDRLVQWTSSPVALHDISRQETMEFLMRPEDRRTIVALKARFTSLLGRRQLRHTDAGSDLDVQALLEARFTGDQDIFHDDQEVQGFESLLLVDGSASMWSRWATVARAAKVLSQSMSLPCAKLSTWVFSGSNEGVTGIFRFKDPSFGFLPKAQYRELWGLTPMHIALGVGIRHLRHSPGGIRQLFLVTDGRPTQFSSLRAPAPSDLEGETAHQVSEARASGIKVSTLIVGTEIRDASADRMFGKGGWCRVQQHHDDLYREMISLVDRSFTRYLRT